MIDDPNSAEFKRISNRYKAAVAKSKPLLEETYNDRNPNRFSESRKQAQESPLGRWGTAAEVGSAIAAIAFLVSEELSYMTTASVDVNGGIL